jgi:hypothetical protein
VSRQGESAGSRIFLVTEFKDIFKFDILPGEKYQNINGPSLSSDPSKGKAILAYIHVSGFLAWLIHFESQVLASKGLLCLVTSSS